MTLFETIIIAIVEGLTEFLPVSSTGHMIITQGLLGVKSTEFVKAFTVVIQFGAILSVVCLYWKRFFQLNLRVCWNWQTGTFEGRVSLAYGFKSRHSHQNRKSADENRRIFDFVLFILNYSIFIIH